MTRCQMYQTGDSMRCAACALQWATDDPEPPTCGMAGLGMRAVDAAALRKRFERRALVAGLSVMMRAPGTYDAGNTELAWKWFRVGLGMK